MPSSESHLISLKLKAKTALSYPWKSENISPPLFNLHSSGIGSSPAAVGSPYGSDLDHKVV